MNLLLLIFILLFPLETTNESQGNTSLELLTSDFYTLTRITNAISLQSSILRQTVPIRQFVVEILKVTPDDFADILRIDHASAISRFKTWKEILEKTGRIRSSRIFEDSLASLKSLEGFQDFSIAFESLESSLKSSLKKLSLSKTEFLGICQHMNFDFLKIIRDRRKGLATDFKYLIEFSKAFPSLLDCYKNLEGYGHALGTLPIQNLTIEYENLLQKHFYIREGLAETPYIIRAIEKDLKMTDKIWGNFSDGDYGNQSMNSWMAHLNHLKWFEGPRPAYAMFLKAGDLRRVEEDLDSEWFKKNLVKGASTKKLRDGLVGFRRMALGIEELYRKWRDFEMQLDGPKGIKIASDLQKASYSLSAVEDYILEYGTQIRPQFDVTCIIDPDPDFEDDLDKLNIQEAAKREALRALSSLSFYVREDMVPVIGDTRYLPCLKTINQEVQDYGSWDQNDIDWVADKLNNAFLECTERNVEFEAFLEHFERLGEKQQRVLDAIEKWENGNQGTMKVGEVLKKANVEKSMECLRSKNAEIPKLMKLIDALFQISKYGKQEKIDIMIEYLTQIQEIKKFVQKVESSVEMPMDPSNPVLALKNPKYHVETIALCTNAIRKLVFVQKNQKKIQELGEKIILEGENFNQMMTSHGIMGDFLNLGGLIPKLVKQMEEMEEKSRGLIGKDLGNMSQIFQEIGNVIGISGPREKLNRLAERYKNDPKYKEWIDYWRFLASNDLDFAAYKDHLKQGYSTIMVFNNYFDRIFGRIKEEKHKTVIKTIMEGSWFLVIGISIGILLFIFVAFLIIYGFTKSGREKYQDWWIFYFGKPEHFEKRWRYAAFTDTKDGKNSLLDAVREINDVNLKKELKRGAYIRAYNKFGNTALHVVTKAGHPDLVEMLIRHGADRSLLNVKNRTPEQCIPVDFQKMSPEDAKNYRRIQEIYRKYHKKKYRYRVPSRFPSSSFHIFVDEAIDVDLANQFMDKFKSIVNLELIPTTTHYVVKTDDQGILETDSLEFFLFLFNGSIIIKDQWIQSCINNEQSIHEDSKFLVERLRYKGVVYDTVIQWTMSMAKSEIPYLYGVQVALVMKECATVPFYSNLIASQGGNLLSNFPLKENYRHGARPYLHAHLGPLFLIHDGKVDLSAYANDKMYTMFTEEEFLKFMLKREIFRDTSRNPLNVLLEED